MTLYLLRHGDAIEHGYEDAERPLSEIGKEQAAVVGKFMRASGISPDRIVSSPLKRARQMADLIHRGLATGTRSVSEYLVPGTDSLQLIRQLNEFPDTSALLVGHEPQLRTFLSTLVTGTADAHIALRKGTLASLDIRIPVVPGSASLKWLLTNEQMRSMPG